MKKDSNKIIVKTNDLGLADDVNKDFETFKSIVANAVLDYMESQSDSDLLECLEKANIFLTNISLQMENVFNNQKQSFKDQNDMLEVVDDLFSTKQQTLSNSIHWFCFYFSWGKPFEYVFWEWDKLVKNSNSVTNLQQVVEVIKVTNKILIKS